MRNSATLWRMLGTRPPYESVVKVSQHLRRDIGTQRLDSRAFTNLRQDYRFLQVGRLACRVCIEQKAFAVSIDLQTNTKVPYNITRVPFLFV